MSRNERADVFVLLGSSFAVATSNSVIFAALSDLQDTYGFSDAGLGYIAGTGFAAGLLVNLFVAPLADRGWAKRLILLAMVMGAVGSTLLALGDSLPDFVVARAIIGCSFGLAFPAVRALLAHLDPSKRGLRLGRLAGVELLGFVAGPLLGGLLIDPIGLSPTFLVFAVLNLVSITIVLPRSFPPLLTTSESGRLSIGLLTNPRVRIAVIVFMAIQAPVGIFDALWDRYITDLGGGNAMVGISFALYTIPFIVFSSFGGRLADRHDPQVVSMLAMILVVPAVAGYGMFKSLAPVIGLNVAEGVVQALTYPAAAAAVAIAAPPGRAGAAMGLAGAAGLFMSMLIAFIAPPVYGAGGGGLERGGIWAFGGVGVLMALLTATAVVLWVRERRRAPVAV